MILSCNNIDKTFVDNHVLKNASFHIEDYEKAAIVGINGAGKSTLLKIITGSLPADGGLVTFAKDKSFGYLAQHQAVDSENTIFDELLTVKQEVLDLESSIRQTEQEMKQADGAELDSLLKKYANLTHRFEDMNGYACKSEITGILKGLGFGEDEFGKKVATLSGGQKTRVALGKLLLQKPDLIMLDEPTNHLDLNSITWLETYLLNYKGAVIIVSHDRYFLDRIATKIIEIDNGIVSSFHGNYSDYAVQKEHLRTEQMHAYLNQQREIKHQEEVIDKLKQFNREKSIKRAESREKMLDKIERLEKPVEVKADMKLILTPHRTSGNDVMQIEGLSKRFGSHLLFENVSFEIKRGEHVAVIGDNGTGKTTLLKIINELVPPDGGSIRLGANVEIGYYDQEHHVLHMEKTAFEEVQDAYPNLTNTQVRNILAAFLFTGDDVFKKIADLSGGERGRISLAKLMLSEANFLILDEPTNHLDITSKEILEHALQSYTGTVLYVSHDRYFINQTATRILELTGQTLINYIGNYDYYLEKRETMTSLYASDAHSPSAKDKTGSVSQAALSDTKAGNLASADSSFGTASSSNVKLDWQAQKEEQARIRKRQNDLKKTEDQIHLLETRDKEIDQLLQQEEVYTNIDRLMELNQEKQDIQNQLEELYERWETLV